MFYVFLIKKNLFLMYLNKFLKVLIVKKNIFVAYAVYLEFTMLHIIL